MHARPWGYLDFHGRSKNLASPKRLHKSHQIHYDPHVMAMVASAPMQIAEARITALPATPIVPDTVSILQAIATRTSRRAFAGGPLELIDLAYLLKYSVGIREMSATGALHRAYPSSGNLGSIELFPIVMAVEGVDPGIYHYNSVHHHLELVRAGSFATWLREMVLYQLEFAHASVAFVLVSAVGRLAAKYGERAYRLSFLDTGHVSQNLYLVGECLDVQICATAGFIDDELELALGLDGASMIPTLVVLAGPS